MSRPIVCAAVLIVLALAGPEVRADSLVLFKDGRYFEASSHEIHGEWMRLNVAARAYLIFPLDQVESIDRAGRRVYPAVAEPARPTVTSSSSGSPRPARAAALRASRSAPVPRRADLGIRGARAAAPSP